MMDVFEEKMEGLEDKEERLYREVIEAANYVSQHSMMHYDGKYDTVDLLLTNEQAERRLDSSIETVEDIKQALEDQIQEIDIATVETGASPRYVEKARDEAENTLETLEDEIKHIKEARENPPEEEADQDYVESRETRAETVADRIDYTPKRKEQT